MPVRCRSTGVRAARSAARAGQARCCGDGGGAGEWASGCAPEGSERAGAVLSGLRPCPAGPGGAAGDMSLNPAADSATARQQVRRIAAVLVATAAGRRAGVRTKGPLVGSGKRDLHVSSVQLLARLASSLLLAYHEILTCAEMARYGAWPTFAVGLRHGARWSIAYLTWVYTRISRGPGPPLRWAWTTLWYGAMPRRVVGMGPLVPGGGTQKRSRRCFMRSTRECSLNICWV